MKSILSKLRNHRILRPLTEQASKAICIELLLPMRREHELAMKAALEDEDGLATLRHLGRMSHYAVKTTLTWRSILLHLRLLVGSKKERMAILSGCLDASFELMQKNPIWPTAPGQPCGSQQITGRRCTAPPRCRT